MWCVAFFVICVCPDKNLSKVVEVGVLLMRMMHSRKADPDLFNACPHQSPLLCLKKVQSTSRRCISSQLEAQQLAAIVGNSWPLKSCRLIFDMFWVQMHTVCMFSTRFFKHKHGHVLCIQTYCVLVQL